MDIKIKDVDKQLIMIYEKKESELLNEKANEIYNYILTELRNMRNLINDDEYLEEKDIFSDYSLRHRVEFKEGHFVSNEVNIEDIDIKDFLYFDNDLINAKKRIDERIEREKEKYIKRIKQLEGN